jgi:hypothetical protein
MTDPSAVAVVETPVAGAAIDPGLLRFAERQPLTAPLGDYGFTQYGGIIYDEVDPRLQGQRWHRTVAAMLNDAVLSGALFATELLIRQAEWNLDPAEGDEINAKKAGDVADFVETCLDDMRAPLTDTMAQVLSFLPYGFSLFELVYKRRNGDRGDQPSAYEDGRIGWDEWAPRSQDTVTRWAFDDRGHASAIIQQSPSMAREVEIPLARCLHFRAGGYWGSPEGRSILRPVFELWNDIRKIRTTENIGLERDLAGLPLIYLPSALMSPSAPAAYKAAYEEYKKIGVNLRRGDQAVVALPSDVYEGTSNRMYDLKLLSTGGQRQIDTSAVIRQRTSEMTGALLADFMQLGHEGVGSFALSQDKTQLFTTAISAWLDVIAKTINHQAIRPLLRLNGIDLRLAPTLRPGTLDEVNLAATADYVAKLQPLIAELNAEDRLALTANLFDRADFPAPTTKPAETPTGPTGPAAPEQPTGPTGPAEEPVITGPSGPSGPTSPTGATGPTGV